ncbi:DUF1343 domain-containing protein [Colwellia sp. RSH04]|nr:DUF1343 domain-containing protein [Colwellia sp. RSH04]
MSYSILITPIKAKPFNVEPQPKLQSETLSENISDSIKVGAEQLSLYLPLIKDKRIGLVVNQTSRVQNQHIVDYLINKGLNVEVVFAPEHGFRGNHEAGETVNSGLDKASKVKVYSIYGKQKKPSAKVMKQVDVLLFDIQDVGVRYYTYISSMHYMMEAAANNNIPFIVLDRPNPNGKYVDGPVLDKTFQSFVGVDEIPLLHGMTVGELALMINGENWINKKVDLTIIPVKNYHRKMDYSLPIKPSPNLPNDIAIAHYASLGFFEATPVSIGRGTHFPFQVIGFNDFSNGDFTFTPRPIKGVANSPKLSGEKAMGQDLRAIHTSGLDLSYLIAWYNLFKQHNKPFFTRSGFMDKLSGTDKLRKQIQAGLSQDEIKQSWQQGLDSFKKKRQPYLLYP